jgi:aldehyde dehydrogenase (NAD+)
MASKNSIESLVNNLRQSFNSNATRDIKWRLSQLKALERLIDENQSELTEALRKDLHKHSQETATMEFGLIKNAINHTSRHLKQWMKPQKATPIIQVRAIYSMYTVYEPLGVTLIIGAWNYPYQLTLVPLVGSLASGNCSIVKPSELSPNSAALLEKIWSKYFDSNYVALVNGGVTETTELLNQRFDHIFYTGSTSVGKIVMRAAANHMTPVTLECGGKSPLYIDDSSNLEIAAKRTMWAKFVNAGQTCVAPDYVLCSKETQVGKSII